jgi:hypothetical protein
LVPAGATGNHTIEVGTDAVMLESARQQDEAAAVKGETGGPRRTERMRENRMALETLREAFERVTGEARTVGAGIDNQSPASLLFSLQLPGDRLVYRPGYAPRLRLHGEWQEIGEQPLSPPVYQELRSRLIDSRFGGATDSGRTRRILLSDGRTVALDVVNEGSDETLWLKLADFAPIQPEELRHRFAPLPEDILRDRGSVMIGGHTLEDARLGSTRWLVRSPRGTAARSCSSRTTQRTSLKVPAWCCTPDHMDWRRAANCRRRLGGARPHSARGDAHRGSRAAPRIMAGVVAPDIASLLPRWLARLASELSRTTMAYLATTSIHLVMTEHDGGDIDSLFLTVRLLDEAQRALALAGKTARSPKRLERPRGGAEGRSPAPHRS